jgi:hypothetical protein
LNSDHDLVANSTVHHSTASPASPLSAFADPDSTLRVKAGRAHR